MLASIVESSDDAIIGKTLDGIITTWNPAAERIYGYTKEEIIGKPISILIPPDRPGEMADILARIREGDRVEHFETSRLTKDGRRIQVSVTISPIRDASGATIGASAIARDITAITDTQQALRESESTANALLRSAAQGIFIVDPEGKITMANPATEKMFGYSADELIGQSVDMLVPERLRGSHRNHRDHYFSDPESRPMGLGMDLQARRKDGTELYVEISLSYIRSANRTLGVAFVTDISKRRADEQAIRQHREELRALAGRLMTAQDDERRRIARNLHDDLSQQLAHLAIDLGNLATKPSAREFIPELRPIQLCAAEAADTVRRISHDLHPSILDDLGLEAACEQFCEDFQQRTGIVTSFTSRNVPESLRSEIAGSIYHIAQECLRNVAKHAQTESVAVILEGAPGALRLTVKDQGVGLPAERSEHRTGIGIAAMRERAHLVNGSLTIQSGMGAGTEVSVEVPMGGD